SEEAIKEAGLLTRFAEIVYLITPSQRLKTAEDNPDLAIPNLKVITGHAVAAIEGGEIVEKILLKDARGVENTLELAGVFIYIHGSKPIVDFLRGSVEVSEEGCIVTNAMKETSIPGVFSAGDVTCGEVRQVVVAAAQGCLAALSAEKYVFHRQRTK